MLPVIARDVESAIEAPLFITSLATKIEAVDCETLCETVYERFSREPELFALPVVEGVKPVGLVNRQGLLVRLADRFGRALFEQKPITKLMDPEPLVVADEMTVEALGAMIVETRQSALLDGFIITRDGAYPYHGVGTALSLITLTLEQARQRNRMLDEARMRAEAANESKTQFLANMSHELRTPLNAVIGFSHILATEMFGPLGRTWRTADARAP